MKKERKDFLIILAVVVLIVLAYILSGIFMQPEPQKSDIEPQLPGSRLDKIREGFVEK